MDELTWNPEAALVVQRRQDQVVAVTATVPVRGRPLRVVTFSQQREPAIFDLLQRVAAGAGEVFVELAEADLERLAEVGLLAPEDKIPRAPRFRCPPRDPPQELLPRRPSAPAPSGERLQVNPTLRYRDEARPPDEGWVRRRAALVRGPREVNPFDASCAWAWVLHPDVPVPSALSVDAPDRALFQRLRPGEPAPTDLDPALHAALVRAGVLVAPADLARRREAWARTLDAAGEALRRDRYAVVRGLIHPTQIAALRRYYRELIGEGYVRLGCEQVSLRYAAHNEPLARFFHQQLAGLVAALAGEAVKPSYVYFASYRPGAELAPHRDRTQCTISISLLLDYEPDPLDVSPWPLFVGLDADAPRGRAAAIDLGLGDGLFYRGAELCHWRHALPEGHASTSLFLHYVPAAFAGTLD